MAFARHRRAPVDILLHLRGYTLQSHLVRHDDLSFLRRPARTFLYQAADRRSEKPALFSHWHAVLCVLRIPALDSRLLLAQHLTGKPHLLV